MKEIEEARVRGRYKEGERGGGGMGERGWEKERNRERELERRNELCSVASCCLITELSINFTHYWLVFFGDGWPTDLWATGQQKLMASVQSCLCECGANRTCLFFTVDCFCCCQPWPCLFVTVDPCVQ